MVEILAQTANGDRTLELLGGGILTVLVLKQVFEFIGKRWRNGDGDTTKMAQQVDSLFRIHDVRDELGVPVWHNTGLRRTLEGLTTAINQQTAALTTTMKMCRSEQVRLTSALERVTAGRPGQKSRGGIEDDSED